MTVRRQTSLQAYEQLKLELADVIRSANILAREEKAEQLQRQYQELAVRLAEDQFNLAVVGQFNRGKTSLMNAVLGMDRLPTGIVPLTSVITTVRYGTRERVLLHYDDRWLAQEVTLADLPQYVTQIGNPGNRLRIRSAEVQLPAGVLRRGFFFVDTPGLGSAIATNTATTEDFSAEMDAVILVTSFEGPLSKEEVAFLERACRQSRKVFLVINKVDLVSDDDKAEVLQYVRNTVRGIGIPDLPLFALSARDGLTAKLQREAVGPDRSGLSDFERELVRFLTTEKTKDFLARSCERVEALLELKAYTPEVRGLLERVEHVRSQVSDGLASDIAFQTASDVAQTDNARVDEPCPVCTHVVEQVFRVPLPISVPIESQPR